jgi:hypothetical protein
MFTWALEPVESTATFGTLGAGVRPRNATSATAIAMALVHAYIHPGILRGGFVVRSPALSTDVTTA